MKAKKKTNHLLEEADKIKQIPEEKNDGREGQDEAIKAKKPRKNRFLARLQKTWARITGCMRSCCTSIQDERSAEEFPEPSGLNMKELPGPSRIKMEEELPEPSDINMEEPPDPNKMTMEELPTSNGVNMEELPQPKDINMEELRVPSGINMEDQLREPSIINMEEHPEPSGTDLEELPGHIDLNMKDSKANMSSEERKKEDDVEEKQNQNIKTDKEAELVTDIFVEQEVETEYQHLLDLIHNQEDLYIQYYTSQQEILAEYNRIHDVIQSIEDLYIQFYNGEELVTDSFVEQEVEAEYQHLLDLIHNQEDLYVQYYTSQQEILAEYDRIHDVIQSIEDLYIQFYNGEELVTDSFVEQEVEAEYQHLLDLIHNQEDLSTQYYTSQQEILAECDRTNDLINSIEDLYIQYYNGEDKEEQNAKIELESKVGNAEVNIKEDGEDGEQDGEEELESKVEDNEVKIKEVREHGLENAESVKDSQRASCEVPGPNHISSRANESPKGKEKEDDQAENISIASNENREQCRFERESSHKCSSLEDKTPEKLHKSSKASQSSSSHDEEPSTSGICLEKLKQPVEESSATVPLTLQSFTFHQTLGEGSFGEVYLATDIIHKECVAIKVSSKLYFTERGYNFVERDILALSHENPYLINGLAAFHTQNFVYYVMELASRGDLYLFLRKNRHLDTPTIQFIIAEVICGTQFLHKKNIIHRDLKTQNILLTADGHIKITDFSLAAMDVNDMILDQCGGTFAYMAPEVMSVQKHGRGVDYFAIGIILYRMHTSKLPFSGGKRHVLSHAPLYPEFLTPDTVDVLQGLLCKNQYNRLGVKSDVRNHPYFSNINWEDVEARRVTPPPIMTAASIDLSLDQTLDYVENPSKIRSKDQKIFKQFSFVCPEWSHRYHPDVTIETKSWMAKLFTRRPF